MKLEFLKYLETYDKTKPIQAQGSSSSLRLTKHFQEDYKKYSTPDRVNVHFSIQYDIYGRPLELTLSWITLSTLRSIDGISYGVCSNSSDKPNYIEDLYREFLAYERDQKINTILDE